VAAADLLSSGPDAGTAPAFGEDVVEDVVHGDCAHEAAGAVADRER
jgi:hypothetical protein